MNSALLCQLEILLFFGLYLKIKLRLEIIILCITLAGYPTTGKSALLLVRIPDIRPGRILIIQKKNAFLTLKTFIHIS